MERIVLALDLGGTNLRVAAIGESGTIYSRSRGQTPHGTSGAEVVDLIVRLADECRSGLDAGVSVSGIAAAVPATIDSESGVLIQLPNLRSLEGFPLRDQLSERLGLLALLENDATAAAIGENWLGASRDVDDSICVTLGTGVGGGLIINGDPYRGKDGTAGEVGHICVEPLGEQCGCGSRGCVEQYASATAVVRIARESGMEVDSSLEVYDAALNGSEQAKQSFRVIGIYLGIALAGLVNVLNPEMIVIGGGVSSAWEFFIVPFTNELRSRSFREPFERVKIVRAELGDDAGILGAARSALSLVG